MQITQFSNFQKIFLPEFIAVLKSGSFLSFEREKEKEKKLQISKTKSLRSEFPEKKEEKIFSHGFVSYPFKIAKTPTVSFDRCFENLIKKLENNKSIDNYKDPLTMTIVYPLLCFCRQKDYLKDGAFET